MPYERARDGICISITGGSDLWSGRTSPDERCFGTFMLRLPCGDATGTVCALRLNAEPHRCLQSYPRTTDRWSAAATPDLLVAVVRWTLTLLRSRPGDYACAGNDIFGCLTAASLPRLRFIGLGARCRVRAVVKAWPAASNFLLLHYLCYPSSAVTSPQKHKSQNSTDSHEGTMPNPIPDASNCDALTAELFSFGIFLQDLSAGTKLLDARRTQSKQGHGAHVAEDVSQPMRLSSPRKPMQTRNLISDAI
jgi:hypothetical protein